MPEDSKQINNHSSLIPQQPNTQTHLSFQFKLAVGEGGGGDDGTVVVAETEGFGGNADEVLVYFAVVVFVLVHSKSIVARRQICHFGGDGGCAVVG